jgi:hypothetical protein
MAIKYTKWLYNIPNDHKMYQYFPFLGRPKFTKILIFGLKICIPSGSHEFGSCSWKKKTNCLNLPPTILLSLPKWQKMETKKNCRNLKF